MKKNLRLLLLSSLLCVIPACQGTTNSSSNGNNFSSSSSETSISQSSASVVDKDVYEKEEPVLQPDSKLGEYDDIPFFYDNRMIMESIGGSKEVPDPFVYRFNGMYYLYPTTNGGYVKAYKSQDLINWELVDNGVLNPGYVYSYSNDPNGKHPDSQTPFAPEVTYFNGKFYMIASPSGNGHYVFESDSPEGPFSCVSENLGHSIDGSYFINSDEEIILYGASGSSIVAYSLDEDMQTFLTNDLDQEIRVNLDDCRVGNWNEGPYMLQKNGDYYFTYCGTHYLSKSYRVDYAYCKNGSNLLKGSSYNRQDTVVVSTEDNFNGLGHSSTVLAPDMDSHYIVYHNLESNAQRFLNLSRLSFNGSKMVANDVRLTDLIGVDFPPFYTYDTEGFVSGDKYMLSPDASGESFTVEFNTIGEGKMIFSYNSDQNYSYMEFKDNDITVNKVIDGVLTEKYRVDLIRDYSTEVMHTFRLQYHEGKMNIYFDNMEKASGIDAYFIPGKIGYEVNNSFSTIGYTAFSNVARGSSDQKVYNREMSLANAYDSELSYLREGSGLKLNKQDSYNLVLANKDDRATYRIYEDEGDYSLNLRVAPASIGKRIGVRIDNGEIRECLIDSQEPRIKNTDIEISLGIFHFTKGQHNITFYNIGDEVEFSEIKYDYLTQDDDIAVVFDTNFDDTNFMVRNSLNLSNKGIFTDNQNLCGVVSKGKYMNASVEADMRLNSMTSAGYVGLTLNVTDYSKNYQGDGDGGDNQRSYRGYRFVIDEFKAYFQYMDFNYPREIKMASIPSYINKDFTMKVVQNNNHYICYIDDTPVIDIYANLGNLSGSAGVFASGCEAYISTLSIYHE